MKNKNTLKTAIEFSFLFIIFIFCLLIRLGISQDVSELGTGTFWIESGSQFLLVMTTFNVVFNMDKTNNKHDISSRFYKAYATNRLRIKEIERNKRFDELDAAIEKKNAEMLEDKCNIILHRLCTRIDYKDVMEEIELENGEKQFAKTIDELLDECRCFPKRKKKLAKRIKKIRSGSVRIHKIKAKMFLRDKELIFIKRHNYDFNVVFEDAKYNLLRASRSILLVIVFGTISFSFAGSRLLETIFSNTFLMFSAILSGFSSSKKEIKKETAVYETRNAFLSKYLNIDVEYVEETH